MTDPNAVDPLANAATDATKDANASLSGQLNWDDDTDFKNAEKGLVLKVDNLVIKNGDKVVWDMTTYEAYEKPVKDHTKIPQHTPDTVNPSLWRQALLNNIYGLFRVAEAEKDSAIYQVRGYDLSNMTIVEAPQGLIVIDPLISQECAYAALQLYYQYVKKKPVVAAVIYTHSHVDHFGGVMGVKDQNTKDILAPEGFLEHAASENVYAGVAMARRAQYMYGPYLPKNAKGQVDAGLGKTQSTGTVNLAAPTIELKAPPAPGVLIKQKVAGLNVYFQLTPGTEAPSEMNFYFPKFQALCLAENATHNIHNIVTLRGAVVRDSLAWSKYLQQTIQLFCNNVDDPAKEPEDTFDIKVAFAQHHWPTWGKPNIVDFLAKQRDLYRFMNDQTLRLLNNGYTGIQIAEKLRLPATLNKQWHCRGYYGSLSHNVKAIYQRYMGWFDGNPSNLWALPQLPVAKKYVEYMGGADNVLKLAQDDYYAGNYRWVAEVLKHVVTNDPENNTAVQLLADTLEQLGYQAEPSTWRNFYLMGAKELRHGIRIPDAKNSSSDFLVALTLEMLFDSLAVKIKQDKAEKLPPAFTLAWKLIDTKQVAITTIENAALSYLELKNEKYDSFQTTNYTVITTRDTLNELLATFSVKKLVQLEQSGAIQIANSRLLLKFFKLLDTPTPNFPIVIPKQ